MRAGIVQFAGDAGLFQCTLKDPEKCASQIAAAEDVLKNFSQLCDGFTKQEIAAIFHVFVTCARNGITSTVVVAMLCVTLHVAVVHTPVQIRKLWSSLRDIRQHCTPIQAYYKATKKHYKGVASCKVSEHVQSSTLPEHMDLSGVVDRLAEMQDASFQARRKRKSDMKEAAVAANYSFWQKIAADLQTIEALEVVGRMIDCCDSGFVQLNTIKAAVDSVFEEHSESCGWSTRCQRLVEKLLKYLPVVHIVIGKGAGDANVDFLAARPPGGNEFLRQIASLAEMAENAYQETKRKLGALPVKQYLTVIDTERDRRVFKGLVAQITNHTFVRSEFGWRKESIASIEEELGLVEFHTADMHNLLLSMEYVGTKSVAKRKRMRRDARAKWALLGYLNQKRGGRPSKLEKYSCCLGRVVAAAMEEVESGAIRAAPRRRADAIYRGIVVKKKKFSTGQNGPRHSGGRGTLQRITELVRTKQ